MTRTRVPSGRRSAATLEAVLDLLKRLARVGASIDVADIDQCRPVLVRSVAGSAQPPAGIPSVAIAEAMRRCWIEPLPGGGRLGLSAEGRAALRRAASRQAQDRAASGRADPVIAARSAAAAKSGPAVAGANPAESPLAWLRSRRDVHGRPLLSEEQFSAGERLRVDLTFAGLTPRVTMGWSGLPLGASGGDGSGLGRDIADNVVASRERVVRALDAVGPEAAGLLIDVCGHLKGLGEIAEAQGWPRRSVKLVLLQALTALARHYGLLPVVPAERTLNERLRHWGTSDFRPSLSQSRDAALGDGEVQAE